MRDYGVDRQVVAVFAPKSQQTPLFELTQIAFPLSEYSNILFIY